MKRLLHHFCVASTLAFALGAGFAKPTLAQTITNGYVCSPKNPGGEETRLYFRQQDGMAINLAPNATFPVVCPVVVPFGDSSYSVIVRVGNAGSANQTFACAIEEYNLSFNLVRSIGKSVVVPPGQTGALSYEGIRILAQGNFLSLRCILPPRGAIGTVYWS